MAGTFLVLDGPDGSGTTKHSRLLADRLALEGVNVVLTAEPTPGPIGSFVRQLLREHAPLPSSAMQLLFCADRAAHVEQEILPALAAGKTVVCDRYAASTVAYGEALGVDPVWLGELNNKFVRPNRSIFLLPPLEICLERLGRRDAADAYENEELQRKVHAAYRRLAAENPDIAVIDSAGSIEETAERIWEGAQPSAR